MADPHEIDDIFDDLEGQADAANEADFEIEEQEYVPGYETIFSREIIETYPADELAVIYKGLVKAMMRANHEDAIVTRFSPEAVDEARGKLVDDLEGEPKEFMQAVLDGAERITNYNRMLDRVQEDPSKAKIEALSRLQFSIAPSAPSKPSSRISTRKAEKETDTQETISSTQIAAEEVRRIYEMANAEYPMHRVTKMTALARDLEGKPILINYDSQEYDAVEQRDHQVIITSELNPVEPRPNLSALKESIEKDVQQKDLDVIYDLIDRGKVKLVQDDSIAVAVMYQSPSVQQGITDGVLHLGSSYLADSIMVSNNAHEAVENPKLNYGNLFILAPDDDGVMKYRAQPTILAHTKDQLDGSVFKYLNEAAEILTDWAKNNFEHIPDVIELSIEDPKVDIVELPSSSARLNVLRAKGYSIVDRHRVIDESMRRMEILGFHPNISSLQPEAKEKLVEIEAGDGAEEYSKRAVLPLKNGSDVKLLTGAKGGLMPYIVEAPDNPLDLVIRLNEGGVSYDDRDLLQYHKIEDKGTSVIAIRGITSYGVLGYNARSLSAGYVGREDAEKKRHIAKTLKLLNAQVQDLI